MRLESLVSRLLALKPELVRIALTAVAGGGAAPIARWVEGRNDAEAVETRYRSTRQLIGALLGTPGQSGSRMYGANFQISNPATTGHATASMRAAMGP